MTLKTTPFQDITPQYDAFFVDIWIIIHLLLHVIFNFSRNNHSGIVSTQWHGRFCRFLPETNSRTIITRRMSIKLHHRVLEFVLFYNTYHCVVIVFDQWWRSPMYCDIFYKMQSIKPFKYF